MSDLDEVLADVEGDADDPREDHERDEPEGEAPALHAQGAGEVPTALEEVQHEHHHEAEDQQADLDPGRVPLRLQNRLELRLGRVLLRAAARLVLVGGEKQRLLLDGLRLRLLLLQRLELRRDRPAGGVGCRLEGLMNGCLIHESLSTVDVSTHPTDIEDNRHVST